MGLRQLFFNVSSNASRLDLDTTDNCIELLEKERKIATLNQEVHKLKGEANKVKGEAKLFLDKVSFLFVLFVLATVFWRFRYWLFPTDRPTGATIAQHERRK